MTAISLNRRDTGVAHPADVYVGGRLRQRRTFLGLSQEKLGAKLGLTFQQIQKYERGANRVGASRLWELSEILQVPVGFFFEGFNGPLPDAGQPALEEENTPFEFNDPMAQRESVELIRAYYAITDGGVRRRLFELARALGKAEIPEEE